MSLSKDDLPPDYRVPKGKAPSHGKYPPNARKMKTRRSCEPARPVATPLGPPPSGPTANDLFRLRRMMAELIARKSEALRLYEPLPAQEEFHASQAVERLVIGSNRGGKTGCTAVEVARAVCGCDPYGKWPKRDGRFVVVGKDQKHIAQVQWRKLSRAGAFKMIRDPATREWRAFRPGEAWDLAHEHLAKPMPPLIPTRMIEEISWENKREGVPSVVRLKTGWEMLFFSSLGKPPQGYDLDGGWFDEEIVDPAWYPEIAARLLDRRGRFLWGATPQAGTQHLYDLHERAQARDGLVEEFLLLLAANPHIAEAEKKAFAAKLNDDEHRVRVGGEFAITGFRVFPEFSAKVHGCEPFDVPPDWCRYMVVDPGRQVCAVLFAAVPPGRKHVYLYDELYIRRSSAHQFGEQVARRIGDLRFEAFIIDDHGSRITEAGSGEQVRQQYSDALAARKIASRRSGSGFLLGNDDVKGRIESAREWLRLREDGTPIVQVFRGRLPNFEWEIARYHYKRDPDGRPTDTPLGRNDHLMADFTYLADFDPQYVKPQAAKRRSSIQSYLEKKRRAERKRDGLGGRDYVRLGPGNP
jgi:hypothetical protein